MHKLKKNQIGPRCSFCQTERATQRTKYFKHYSCNKQECTQQALDAEQQLVENEDHFTEADYQTWNK